MEREIVVREVVVREALKPEDVEREREEVERLKRKGMVGGKGGSIRVGGACGTGSTGGL